MIDLKSKFTKRTVLVMIGLVLILVFSIDDLSHAGVYANFAEFAAISLYTIIAEKFW